jgi:hypothetical protein
MLNKFTVLKINTIIPTEKPKPLLFHLLKSAKMVQIAALVRCILYVIIVLSRYTNTDARPLLTRCSMIVAGIIGTDAYEDFDGGCLLSVGNHVISIAFAFMSHEMHNLSIRN